MEQQSSLAAQARPVAAGDMAGHERVFRALCLGVGQGLGHAQPGLAPIISAGVDADMLLRAARRHRVLLLFARGAAGMLPPGQAALLADAARPLAMTALARAAEAAVIVREFTAAGVDVIALKGAALSQRLHGAAALRDPGDIDLLVRPAAFQDAVALLRRRGYLPTEPALLDSAEIAHRDIGLRHPELRMTVELHRRLTSNPDRLSGSFDSFWAAGAHEMLAGVRVPTLPDGFLPLYLCAHGAHHLWSRLSWIADLSALLPDADRRRRAIADADAAGLGRDMRLALSLGEVLLGAPPTGADGLTARDGKKAQAFARHHFGGARFLSDPAMAVGTLAWARHQLERRWHVWSLRPGLQAWLGEVRADLRHPADLHRMPKGLAWAYPLLRPLALLQRALRARKPGRERRGPLA